MHSDTSPEFDRLQIERLRQATPAQRLATALSMSDTVMWLSRQAIARLHPQWNDRQIRREFARIHYGQAVSKLLAVEEDTPA
ncbi:hypothetical protein OT109_00350 [Phycisphaeraceae bacterium D3-23]